MYIYESQYIHDNIYAYNIKKSIYDNFVLECIITTAVSIKIIWNLNWNKEK